MTKIVLKDVFNERSDDLSQQGTGSVKRRVGIGLDEVDIELLVKHVV